MATSSHADFIDGKGGTDLVDYHDDTAGVTVNLSTGHGSGGTAAGDTYTHIEGVIGGSGNDFLSGGSGDDLLFGGAGNDKLDGGNGSDHMTGGTGADTFVISADTLGGTIHDFITDYSGTGTGGQGDVVDLTNLFNTNGANVSDFVHYDQSTGVLSVDANGTTGGTHFVDVATLDTTGGAHPAAATVTILYDDASNHTTTGHI
jgi:Ca2+-binding RTX toxin-like protein